MGGQGARRKRNWRHNQPGSPYYKYWQQSRDDATPFLEPDSPATAGKEAAAAAPPEANPDVQQEASAADPLGARRPELPQANPPVDRQQQQQELKQQQPEP
ncbi:hypothetical protein PLESTB_001659500 [Pleodorina starrii]|uniref:Uncharacterized protein n=1 Tax=Pleodorina starrii TaxID=330485 RepID=A0A9W6BZH2_9CHLO|nr:hypothetical protein PLESTM_000972000 [Pleodorina starrii]GLC60697.1 hypothetical protein PLESTB_001659500 [Pleodorina starrii]GLC65914.1 hypothetical protein PLESTF_000357700 [Pleodorina starrii]